MTEAAVQGCAYCHRSASTVDHVPPRSLFPAPRPSTLITVPSCIRCNNERSDDEEYLVWMLAIVDRATGPVADELRRQRFDFDSLTPKKRARRERMVRRILNTTRQVQTFAPSGAFAGMGIGYDPQLHRLNRALEKVVRGLYFHQRGIRVPDTFAVAAYAEPNMDGVDRGLLRSILSQPVHTVLRDGFEYWFAAPDDLPEAAVTILRFYQQFSAIGFAGPRPDLES